MIKPKHFKKIIQDEIKKNINDKKREYLLKNIKKKSKSKYSSNPTKIKLDNVKATDEIAFQRAILNEGKTTLKLQSGKKYKVNWLDGELPVIFGKFARRECVDLIGKTEQRMVICELKFMKKTAKSSSYSPMYTLLQLLIYFYFVQRNYEKLDKQDIYHKNAKSGFKWKDFISKAPLLVVVANEKYWDYWIEAKRRKKSKQIFVNWIKNLKSELKLKNNLFLFKTPDENFKEQKGQRERYKPSLRSEKSKKWVEIS